jgi:long-subunit acyl-CoA synthetase (AMP-forming)
VGRPLLEVELVDSQGERVGYGNPTTNVFQSSGARTGELRVHGPNVMKGYLDDPEQTAKVLVEDEEGKVWYRTGDLFSMDDEGFLKFRGRLGRQFKLKNGEFVNPELLERVFARAALVEHVLVYGDQSRSFPLPLVVVDVEEAARQTDIPGLPADDLKILRSHPALGDRVRELLLQEASAAGLPGHERPQKILLLPEALSEEAGTLTRGLKKIIPRAVIERYQELIEKTYAE